MKETHFRVVFGTYSHATDTTYMYPKLSGALLQNTIVSNEETVSTGSKFDTPISTKYYVSRMKVRGCIHALNPNSTTINQFPVRFGLVRSKIPFEKLDSADKAQHLPIVDGSANEHIWSYHWDERWWQIIRDRTAVMSPQ